MRMRHANLEVKTGAATGGFGTEEWTKNCFRRRREEGGKEAAFVFEKNSHESSGVVCCFDAVCSL